MATIYDLADAFQRAVADREELAARRIVAAYAPALREITISIMALDGKIRDAVDRGETVDPVWIFQQDRYAELQRQLSITLAKFGDQVGYLTDLNQRAMVGLAWNHANEIAGQLGVGGAWASVPTDAILRAIGLGGPDTALGALFAKIAPLTQEEMGNAIVSGLALGHNPLTIAPRLRQIAQIPVVRARTIARTEMLRAYREGSRAIYKGNPDLVDGWIWVSARDRTTCPACWAMHGTFHPADEPMGAHPNCRCTMIPSVKGMADIVAPGPAEFDALRTADQVAILGPRGFEAYHRGDVALQDFARFHTDPRWGTSTNAASVRQAIAHHQAGRTLTYDRPTAPAPPLPPAPKRTPKPKATGPATLDQQVRAIKAIAKGGVASERDAIALGKLVEAATEQTTFAGHLATLGAKVDALTNQRNGIYERLQGVPHGGTEAGELIKEYERLGNEGKKVQEEINRAASHPALYVLGKVRPMGGAMASKGRTTGRYDGLGNTLVKRMAAKYFPKDWVAASNADARPARVNVTGDRAHYQHYANDGKAIVQLSTYRGRQAESTAVHELGHRMEYTVAGVRQIETEWWQRRTRGEPRRKLREITGQPHFRDNEVAYEDQFAHPYVGKDYGGSAFEVLSMGLEGLFYGEHDIRTKDPELIHLTLGMLAGIK